MLRFKPGPCLTLLLTLLIGDPVALGARNDWAEGTARRADGASRDYYNRAGLLEWKNRMGDWRDANDEPQGDRAYDVQVVEDDDRPRFVEWDVTTLVREWIDGKHPNQGFLLRAIRGGAVHFRSREHEDQTHRPRLVIQVAGKMLELDPAADTCLDASTYRSLGDRPEMKVSGESNNALLRFHLESVPDGARVDSAVLRLFAFAFYGTAEVGVFRCRQGHELPRNEPVQGLASKYAADRGLDADPDVMFFDGFESADWAQRWSFADGRMDAVESDPPRRFETLRGKAVRVRIAEGANGAMNVGYKFRRETGDEPDEIYLRYYLRLADDWNQTIQGGKMPGISGTYGVAGWGGRKSDGRNGWSARGAFHPSIPPNNPLSGLHPIGTYCYHADMDGTYGDIWLWQNDYLGFLETNRWYSIEQYLKLNVPGERDGILRAWVDGRLAFEKTDIRFRHVGNLKIEQIWMNVYHGGTRPSPHDQHLFIDNVVIARKYVGPMTPESAVCR